MKKIISIIITLVLIATIIQIMPSARADEVKCAFSGKGSNLDNWAITPSIDLTGASSPKLEIITQVFIPVGSGDYGYIKISNNGGSDWTILRDEIQGYTPNWEIWEIDLANWSYPNILIAFEFATESDSISNGWFIQKIEVKGSHEIIYSEDFSGYDIDDPWGDWTIVMKSFSGAGSGTEEDPYQITNADQLNETRDDLDAYYILMNDIDLSGCENWNGGQGFIPIDTRYWDEDDWRWWVTPFVGSFDGQNYSISNLFINRTDSYEFLGLFGIIDSGGVVKNLGLINVDITSNGPDVGGLVGGDNYGSFTNCYSTGVVTGSYRVGGLVGSGFQGEIINCYATGIVTGPIYVGGLIGEYYGSTVTNCYSTGAVTGDAKVGGLVGANYGSTVTNCYSTGAVTGDTDVGGLVGLNDGGTITNSYWDNETSNQITSGGGEGRTTAQMTYPYEGYDPPCIGLYEDWDLDYYDNESSNSIWVHDDPQNDGYPLFRADYVPPLPPAPPNVTTNPATDITKTTATLNGNLVGTGGSEQCNVWFEWGKTTEYGNVTANQTISPSDFNWTEATANANWSARCYLTSTVYDNKIWVMGGGDGSNLLNDVWYSTDGVNWTEATANAGWSARYGYTSVVYDDKMWIMGGEGEGSYCNDVWYSTDGVNWTEATASANWSGRFYFASTVYDNKMWVMGGYDGTNYNDVWYSTDGVNWTEATANAGWSARYYHSSVVFDNKMWVLGGWINGRCNDVWYSTDGVNWTEATANAGWSARYGHTSVVYDDKMWVIGGYDANNLLNDVWYSTDGVNWTVAMVSASWSARVDYTSVVYNNKMWVMGGIDYNYYLNNVWNWGGRNITGKISGPDFNCDIDGLTPRTFYHYHAVADNGIYTNYSEDVIFSTLDNAPIVTNGTPNNETVSIHTDLSVDIFDPDNDPMNITFFLGNESETVPNLWWDNGDTDGSNGYSVWNNLGRSLLDDFELNQTTQLNEFRCYIFYLGELSTDWSLKFLSDNSSQPGDVIATSNKVSFTNILTGRTWFGYPECELVATFDPVQFAAGRYWVECTGASDQNVYWMVKSTMRGTECWVNYSEYGGLQSGTSIFGAPADLSFQLWSNTYLIWQSATLHNQMNSAINIHAEDYFTLYLGKNYSWYATADDGIINITSDTWTFQTLSNNLPNQPTNEIPVNNSIYIIPETYMNVTVSDPDADNMTVIFKWQNGTTIATLTDIANNSVASIYLPDYQLIAHDTDYYWYVVVSDGIENTTGPTWEFHTSKAWDLNGDGTVNYLDVSALVFHYGESGAPGWIPEDINDDGTVNYLDVSSLVSHYGESY